MHSFILIVIAFIQAVSAFTCPKDIHTFYHADVSTGCQVYHLCQNSQLQTFTCPLGQAFNHITSQCEDSSTVSCIETLDDHSHHQHQHHHHHRRSVKRTQNVRDRKLFKAALGKKVQGNRTKRSNMIPEDFQGAGKSFTYVIQVILKYCIHFESCNSSRIANASGTPFSIPDLQVANHDLPTESRFLKGKYLLEISKKIKDSLRGIFMQYFNIDEDEFLTFYFDDMLMPLTEKYSFVRNIEISKFFDKNADVDKIVTEKHTEKYSATSENVQTEKTRRSFANRLAALYQMILIYCKDYESCDSSRLPNASRWGTEILGDWNVTKFEREYPGASIYALLKILEDNKEMTDILRQKFMSYFNISEDVFLTVIFDF